MPESTHTSPAKGFAPDDRLRAVVTCGPGVAPIDAVRRITNFSTGELGVLLTEALAAAGWGVTCFKSTAAPYRDPVGHHIQVQYFTTNADLERALAGLNGAAEVRMVFHAAALSDYTVESVSTSEGNVLAEQKISSGHAELRIRLAPAPKVLPKLAGWFPSARIVGWKYELDGSRAAALEKGFRQVREKASELCVVNGAGYGTGFGVVDSEKIQHEVVAKEELCRWLVEWARRAVFSPTAS